MISKFKCWTDDESKPDGVCIEAVDPEFASTEFAIRLNAESGGDYGVGDELKVWVQDTSGHQTLWDVNYEVELSAYARQVQS